MRRLLPLVLLFCSAAMPTDPLRDRIIADCRTLSPATLAFDRATHSVKAGGPTRSEVSMVERWDGKAWSMVSINGKQPSPADLRQQAKTTAAAPVPGYYRLAPLLALASGHSTDGQGRTIITIPALPANWARGDGTDLSPHLKAEAVIVTTDGQPWVQQLRVTARENFNLGMIRVTSFEQTSDYRRDDSGRPRLAAQSADSRGTFLGIPGGQKSQVTYTYR